MKTTKVEIFTDENGERWKTLSETPCPQEFNPRKQTFKICFEVEYELELTETQKPHTHIIREKENCEHSSPLDKYLFGEIEDFGKEDCSVIQTKTKANVNVKQAPSVITRDKLPFGYGGLNSHIHSFNDLIFRVEIEYLEKHLPEQLKAVFLKLWGESKAHFSDDRGLAIKSLIEKEEKYLRQRIVKIKRIDQTKYQEFIERIRKIALTLQSEENMPLSKTDIAEKYAEEYENSGNPLQKLRRNLAKYALTFEELLEEVNTNFP